MRQFPRFPDKYLFGGGKGGVFGGCQNTINRVDKNIAFVHKTFMHSQRKDTLINFQNAFSLRLKLP